MPPMTPTRYGPSLPTTSGRLRRSRRTLAAPSPPPRSTDGSTRNAIRSNASSTNSSASAVSPCAARKPSRPSWASSTLPAPSGSAKCRQYLADERRAAYAWSAPDTSLAAFPINPFDHEIRKSALRTTPRGESLERTSQVAASSWPPVALWNEARSPKADARLV